MEQIGTTPLGSLTQTVQRGNSVSLLEGAAMLGECVAALSFSLRASDKTTQEITQNVL